MGVPVAQATGERSQTVDPADALLDLRWIPHKVMMH
jgi:hypothetical protein